MKLPRFTIRRMMVVVAVVAMLLASVRVGVGVAIANEIKRQISLVTVRFYLGTTNAGEGVAPDR